MIVRNADIMRDKKYQFLMRYRLGMLNLPEDKWMAFVASKIEQMKAVDWCLDIIRRGYA